MSQNPNEMAPEAPKAPDQFVTLTVEQFKAITDNIQQLQSRVDFSLGNIAPTDGVTKAPTMVKKENPKCRVWFVQTKKGLRPVVGYGKSMQKFNEQKEAYLEMTLIDADKNEHKVDFKAFRDEANSQLADIIKTEKKEIEVKHGMVHKIEYDYGNYKSKETEELVPLVSTLQKIFLTLRLEDGTELIVPQEAVN